MDDQQVEQVSQFKYPGSWISDDRLLLLRTEITSNNLVQQT